MVGSFCNIKVWRYQMNFLSLWQFSNLKQLEYEKVMLRFNYVSMCN